MDSNGKNGWMLIGSTVDGAIGNGLVVARCLMLVLLGVILTSFLLGAERAFNRREPFHT